MMFLLLGYVLMQLRERDPMLPFDLLKIPIFSMSVVTSILSFTAQMLSLVAMPFYWQPLSIMMLLARGC